MILHGLNKSERGKRDAAIIEMHHNQTPQIDIARAFNLKRNSIRKILRAHGIEGDVSGPEPSMFDTDDPNRLRRAIWRRQTEGARKALAAMRME